MKKLIFLCCALFLGMQLSAAQEKVLERSAKKAPDWIGVARPGQLIVSAADKTLDAARKRCFSDVRQMIVDAVSVNICSEENSLERTSRTDGQENIFREYESRVRAVAGKLPFITDLSPSDGEVYWEHRMNRRTREMFYVCHMKYPFPDSRRDQLIAEFLRQDREQYAKYLALKRQLDEFDRIEQIDRALVELNPLINYFFDSRRHDEVVALRKNYLKCYSSIRIVPYENAPGRHLFYFTIDGRRVVTSARPVIKSETAENIVLKPVEDGMYCVTYDYGQCMDDERNTVSLIYRFGGNAVRHDFAFDVRKDKVSVVPFGRVRIRVADTAVSSDGEDEKADAEKDAEDAAPEEDSAPEGEADGADPQDGTRGGAAVVKQIEGEIELRAKYDIPFEVRALSLSYGGFTARIGDMDAAFEGRGTHLLHFEGEGVFSPERRTSYLMRGVLTVYNRQTKKSEEVRFVLPCDIDNQ